jgi:predicted RNA binding protein YcfA (HicA-like mRNA interferase family)
LPRIVPIRWILLEKVIIKAGFKFDRQKGSHRSYIKKGILRPVVIPTYEEVPVVIIMNCIRTAGISREDYLKSLTEI